MPNAISGILSGGIATQPNSPTGTSGQSFSIPTPSTLIVTTPTLSRRTSVTRSLTTIISTSTSNTASATSGVKSSGGRFSNGGVVGVVVGVLSIGLGVCIVA